jgi:2-keto-3-deoxy-L-rhamnonate aldolase RhmA
VSISFAEVLRDSGRTLFGTWVKMPTTVSVELLALAGFDFVVIDMEHAPLGLETVHDLIGAAHSRDMPALVRVPDRAPTMISRTLDSGADGVLVPHVDDVADAQLVVSAAQFPPTGTRGFGPTVRAGSWGADIAEYRRSAQRAFVAPQLESRHAIDAADAIAAVDGVGALFVGPADLSVATGLDTGAREFVDLINTAEAAAKRHEIPIGTAVGPDVDAARVCAQRYDFVLVGNDAALLRGAGTSLLEAVRSSR